jgi:uncharacterized protein YndB with AHSA1/START domain
MEDVRSKLARARIVVNVDAATCWQAWTDPASLMSWFPEQVEGGELVAGSEIQFSWPSLGQSLAIMVVDAEPLRRLRLRTEPANRPAQHTEISIQSRDQGCEVEIVHAGFRDGPGGDDERAGSEAGWRAALAMLKLYVERYRDRRPERATVLATVSARPLAGYERLAHELGFDEAAVARGRCRLPAAGGDVLIAAPPYYMLVDLPEIEAVAALRTFPVGSPDAPESAILAAQLWSWSLDPGRLESYETVLEVSLARVVSSLGGPTAEA